MNKNKIIIFLVSVFFLTGVNVFAYCETNKEYKTSYAGSCECAPGTQKCYPELEGVGIQTFYCSNSGCGEDSSTPSTSTELVSVISGQSDSSIDITASSTETSSTSTTTSSSSTVVSSGGTLQNPVQWSTFSEVVDAIANWLLTIGLVLAPLMFIIGGVMFATAYGNASQVEKARKLMIYTGIGIMVILLAKSLVEILKGFIG
ncbi:MAG: pilin [Candidatus Pacebacteria bacterium]|nr:pilin [Candidatus Paceibacterota bacterium]MDD3919434.1 pilin [Candidatus Paceibacterota bacterium]